jgi:hypothetical protein
LSINYPVVYDIGRIVTVRNMLKSTLQPHIATAVKISLNTAINQLYLSVNYPVVYDIGRIVTVRNMLKSTLQPVDFNMFLTVTILPIS